MIISPKVLVLGSILNYYLTNAGILRIGFVQEISIRLVSVRRKNRLDFLTITLHDEKTEKIAKKNPRKQKNVAISFKTPSPPKKKTQKGPKTKNERTYGCPNMKYL